MQFENSHLKNTLNHLALVLGNTVNITSHKNF